MGRCLAGMRCLKSSVLLFVILWSVYLVLKSISVSSRPPTAVGYRDASRLFGSSLSGRALSNRKRQFDHKGRGHRVGTDLSPAQHQSQVSAEQTKQVVRS